MHVEIVPGAGAGAGDEYVYRVVDGPDDGLVFSTLLALFDYARAQHRGLRVERQRRPAAS